MVLRRERVLAGIALPLLRLGVSLCLGARGVSCRRWYLFTLGADAGLEITKNK
jgi:hypothetical protein